MLRDWKRDIMQGCGSGCDILRFIFITSWLDWTIIGINVTILILGTSALWTVLTILLAMFVCREAFQMSVSLKRYVFTPENWIEALLIVLGNVLISRIATKSILNQCHITQNLKYLHFFHCSCHHSMDS